MNFFSKLSPDLIAFSSNKTLRFIPIIITFNIPVNKILLTRLSRLKFHINDTYDNLNTVSGSIPSNYINSLSSFKEISMINYDGVASLMGNVGETKSPSSHKKTSSLSGRGVCVGIIDSGIYAHPNLLYKNSIVNSYDATCKDSYMFDSTGHGTAVAGIVSGLAADGNLTSLSYNTSLVCVKAFDKNGFARHSTILKSVDYLLKFQKTYSISIVILPFGMLCPFSNYDILSYACEKLWKAGIFVIAPSGNLGNSECSITSPGSSPFCFSIGAAVFDGSTIIAAPYSGHGPTVSNIMKPDCLVLVDDISTLSYSPNNNTSENRQSYLYKSFDGTCAAAAYAAAHAALLYERLPGISPDTARAILNRCCTSLHLNKQVQGHGLLDLQKINSI